MDCSGGVCIVGLVLWDGMAWRGRGVELFWVLGLTVCPGWCCMGGMGSGVVLV